VVAPVQSGSHKSGQKPANSKTCAAVQSGNVLPYTLVVGKNGQKLSRDLWSTEREWSESQCMQECNKYIILFENDRFSTGGEKQPSGWSPPPCNLVVKKIFEAAARVFVACARACIPIHSCNKKSRRTVW